MSNLLLGTGGGGGGLVPVDIASLKSWREIDMTGADLTLNGSNIIDWGNTADGRVRYSQPTDAQRFVFTAADTDGLAYAAVDGSDDHMNSDSVILPGTQMVVWRWDGAQYIFGTTSGDWLRGLFTIDHSRLLLTGGGGDSFRTNPAGLAWLGDQKWRTIARVSDGTHAGHKIFIDGPDQNWTDGSTVLDPGIVARTLIMGSPFGTPFLGGFRAGLDFETVLTNEELAGMFVYLSRWTP